MTTPHRTVPHHTTTNAIYANLPSQIFDISDPAFESPVAGLSQAGLEDRAANNTDAFSFGEAALQVEDIGLGSSESGDMEYAVTQAAEVDLESDTQMFGPERSPPAPPPIPNSVPTPGVLTPFSAFLVPPSTAEKKEAREWREDGVDKRVRSASSPIAFSMSAESEATEHTSNVGTGSPKPTSNSFEIGSSDAADAGAGADDKFKEVNEVKRELV